MRYHLPTLAVAGSLLLPLVLVGGCPAPGGSPVTAVISASRSSGNAPLTVAFSAGGSSSTNAGGLTYAWDLGDGTTATAEAFEHTFTLPGLYAVRLTVTDSTGAQDTTSRDIRVAGTGATAVLSASATSGDAPLLVDFDASGSSAPDDVIRDYHWDFGDGGESRVIQPQHQYTRAGTFVVTLTVTTAGGVSDQATTTIIVGQPSGSLLFDGSSFATLPLASSSQVFSTCTFETWVRADTSGGTIASIGAGEITIELQPGSNTVRLQLNGVPTTATASDLAGTWRHVAVVYDGITGEAIVYLNGAVLVSTSVAGTFNATNVTLGNGFQGNITEVRYWTAIRTADQIQNNIDDRIGSGASGLLGYWRLDEGSGQNLQNRGTGGIDGVRGATDADDASDPEWSNEGPSLN